MTAPQALAFALMGATIALFVWGKLRYDLIALAALVTGALIGVIPVDEMFSGFANELIWIIAAALVLSAAIARSGVIERALAPVLRRVQGQSLVIGVFIGVVMLLSMVTKNIGALAIMMPVALRNAESAGMPPSRILMPMAFASLLGGLVTLVGTSPNVIVSSVRNSLLGEPYQMFDFSPVGLGVCLVGFTFLVTAAHFIRIQREPAAPVAAALADTRYVTEFELAADSPCVDQVICDLEGLNKDGLKVLSIINQAGRTKAAADTILHEGDHLIVEGDQGVLERMAAAYKLSLVGERHRDEKETAEDAKVIEAVVRQGSLLVGRSAAEARLHENYALSLIAISRHGRRIAQELRAMKLAAGDVLILKAEAETAGEAFAELDLLPLTERDVALGAKRFGFAPILALAGAIGAVVLGAPLPLAFVTAAVAILLLRSMSMAEAYRAVEGPLLVLLAALIPISESISSTGGDRLIAGFLAEVLGPMPIWAAVATLIVSAMAVTPFLNNAATVLIMAPIAAAIARALDISPDPFLMAVAIGAACDFLTPIGHQCNTLVMGPGGYKFWDYWKLGLPLSVLVVLTATPLIVLVWSGNAL
ncbi:MAG TPA: SLC13 family permease [Candidatus Binatia bacterium]|nr:SLC13 family permease [Candidatus Binatia bacterium]